MNDNQETKTALEMSERDIESYADDCDVERELKDSEEVVWVNGDRAYVEHSTHDEIIFVGLANNKSVAVCECITNERNVILDKFWVSDLLKEKPESPEEKAAREREESAYDLYLESKESMEPCMTKTTFIYTDNKEKELWLRIIDKTGYRKQ